MKITANKLFVYMLIVVLSILAHVYTVEMQDFVVNSYQNITAYFEPEQKLEQDEFNVYCCFPCTPSAGEVFMSSMIVLAPFSLLLGLAVWFGKQVLLHHNKNPHQVPTNIWHKR